MAKGIIVNGSFYPLVLFPRGSQLGGKVLEYEGKKITACVYNTEYSNYQNLIFSALPGIDVLIGTGSIRINWIYNGIEITQNLLVSGESYNGNVDTQGWYGVRGEGTYYAYNNTSGGYLSRRYIAVAVGLYVDDPDNITDVGVGFFGNSNSNQPESDNSWEYLMYMGSDSTQNINPPADIIVEPQDHVPDAGGEDGGIRDGSNPNIDILIPALPNIDISSSGNTLYTGTSVLLRQFNNWLWSDEFIDGLKKMFNDPAQAVLGFSVVDAPITSIGVDNIHVGNLDTGISANRCSPWQQVDCGEVKLYEVYGSYVDYSPFLTAELYLPKIGLVQIDPDIIMNNSLRIVYNYELLTGSGVCFLQIKNVRNNVTSIYKYFPCTVTMNIPWSLQDRSQQINAVINAAASTALTGGSSLIGGIIDVATATPSININGNLSGASNILGYKKPYLILKRSSVTKPENYKKYVGYKYNTTATLSSASGFTICENPQISFECPAWVKRDIEEKLSQGVFL